MVKFDLDPAPEEPSRGKGGKKDTDAGLEGVIDELRNVLSGLGSEKDKVESENPPEKVESLPPKNSSPPEQPKKQEEPVKEEKLEEGVLREQAAPSDAEFWSGNVLGWPSDEAPKGKTEPSPQDWLEMQSEESAKKVSELRPGLTSSSSPKESPQVHPEPADSEEAFVVEPEESSGSEVEAPKLEEREVVSPFVTGGRSVEEDSIPPAPPGPFDEEKLPPVPPSDLSEAEGVPTFPESPPVPIPGTIDQRSKAEMGDDFDLEKGTQLPKGFVQIACIYPEGQERTGQQFVFKLKTMGSKLKEPLTIETVYIQPWMRNRVDMKAWCRASHLAGAGVIFVLLAKKDKELFEKLGAVAAEENLKARLISLEQIGMRALYADILEQLKRKAYGKN